LPVSLLQNYKQFETLAEGATESVIVTCPSCQTRFNLDAAKLQPVGRHVRCAKCSHRWLQLPEGMELPAGMMPPAFDEPEPQPEPQPETQAAPEAAPAAPESPAVAEPEAAPVPEPEAAPAPEAAAEAPARPPETAAEVAQSLAAIAEQVAAAGEAGTEKPIPRLDTPSGRLRLGNRATGPITVPPLMRPARPARRSSGLGLLLIAGIIIGVLAAAYLFRDVIARTVPGADAIYAMLHLSTDNPAADLEISIDGPPGMQTTDGKRQLSVTATVFNQSEYPVDVPPLMIVPVDDNGNEMEPILFRLRERVAEPGQNIKFQKSFDNWPMNAKSFVLRTADAP
jgi:predicted Zn finger-like uncharacterized protein